MLRVILTGSACSAAYLLMAGTLSASELVTAAGIGCLGLGWTVVQSRASSRSFAFSPEHGPIWLRAMAGLPLAAARTGAALFRALAGGGSGGWLAEERPFRHGSTDDPSERARRATALLTASLAPTSFVVRADPGRDTVLLHAIDRSSLPSDAEWLT